MEFNHTIFIDNFTILFLVVCLFCTSFGSILNFGYDAPHKRIKAKNQMWDVKPCYLNKGSYRLSFDPSLLILSMMKWSIINFSSWLLALFFFIVDLCCLSKSYWIHIMHNLYHSVLLYKWHLECNQYSMQGFLCIQHIKNIHSIWIRYEFIYAVGCYFIVST